MRRTPGELIFAYGGLVAIGVGAYLLLKLLGGVK